MNTNDDRDLIQKLQDRSLSRRDFLQLLGIAGTAAAALGAPGPLNRQLHAISEARAAEMLADRRNWIYSCCNMCGGQSGIKVLVENGVVRKIEPNEYNPIGVANISTDFEREKTRGARLCPKGNSAVKSLYDPDRLKTPLRRVGARGEGKWQAISWEEAIEEMAAKLAEIRQRYGPETLIWFSEDHSFTNSQIDFCDLYGTPNYHNHSNLCDVSRKAGFKLVMGDERPLADFAHAKYALVFGWNLLSATKWSHLPAIVNRGRDQGMKLVVVDPVMTHTAAKADEWVPLRPGTDGALALALGHVIVTERLYDQAFIGEWTVGFDRYAQFVADKTPERAERITSVPAATIRRIARELAANRPCVVDAWSGPGHHTNATQGTRAIAMLPALLGMYDKPGTLIIPDRKGNKRRTLNLDKPKAPRLDGLGAKYPFGHKSGIYIETREAVLSGQPYQARAAVFVFQNFIMAVPNTQRNIEMMHKLEYVVVIDTHLSETAELADLVVPGSQSLERYDLNPNWVTFPSLGLRQPVVKSWIGGMAEYDFVMAVGRRMGLKDKDGVGFEMSYEQLLDAELKGGIGVGLDELKALPGAVWIGGPTRYEKYAAPVAVPDGGSVDPQTGIIKDKTGKAIGRQENGRIYKGFETPSRKIEFHSEQMAAKGLDPLPDYTDPDDDPTPDYPLYLVGWKQTEHTHTRTFNNVWLMEMKADNPLWINTVTARRLGIGEGDEVWVESPVAKAKATAHVTEGIHPEVVGLHHGYGHWALGQVAKGKGTSDGQFLPGKAERISGQAVTKEVGVKVYKT
jgi:thiosulfate reductase/polysulfide reductase chain A